ncbi:site-specific integrase [Priestia aryabhattai]|uniref:site-specific integrase n=1 Tax=Priestia aryabhattai TaxID=412384 RepID=UPI002E239BA8|nr:site-specific integrase [Priestia aryabhattai]
MALANYKFISREVTINKTIQDKMRNLTVIMIGVLDIQSGIVYPHPLTDFITTKYEFYGKSLNTQDGPAKTVCRFLNYCLQKIEEDNEDFLELKQEGFKGLKRKHASLYITYSSLRGLQKNTVMQYEAYLTAFYVYLKELNLVDEDFPIDKSENSKGDFILKSIFREAFLRTEFPSQDTQKEKIAQLKDFGDNRHELTAHFIRISMDIAPDIALGLCLQFYGGLRRGEVVNLDRGSLNVTPGKSMEVQIRDNRKKFFSRLKDKKAENPKRLNYLNINLARQTILDNDLVWTVYDNHMKQLNNMLKMGKCKNVRALILDSVGNPMSGKVYARRFKKVKDAFIDSLIGSEYYYLFTNTVWSTHIGRGVFTNSLISMDFTPTQLAIARGDKDINSALDYIDKTLTNEQIKKAVNELKKVPTEELGLIDYEHVNRWKNKVG